MDNKKIIRVCKHCNEVKKIEEFELNNIKNGKKFYKHTCKICIRKKRKAYFKEYYQKKKEKYSKKKNEI